MLTLKSYALLGLVHLKFKFSCVSSVFMGSLSLSLSGSLDGVKNISPKFSEMAEAWAGGEPWPLRDIPLHTHKERLCRFTKGQETVFPCLSRGLQGSGRGQSGRLSGLGHDEVAKEQPAPATHVLTPGPR